jgi:hypothetical protein
MDEALEGAIMNASVALNAARAAGIRISIDAGDLVLEATAPPPQDVLDLLRRHKTSIVTLLGVAMTAGPRKTGRCS